MSETLLLCEFIDNAAEFHGDIIDYHGKPWNLWCRSYRQKNRRWQTGFDSAPTRSRLIRIMTVLNRGILWIHFHDHDVSLVLMGSPLGFLCAAIHRSHTVFSSMPTISELRLLYVHWKVTLGSG